MKWWDKSWNPLYGCTACGAGCANCVALANLVKQKRNSAPSFNANIADKPLGRNCNYLVGSLGDVFHEAHSPEHINTVFANMARYPENRYFILTKRSAGMKKFFQGGLLPEATGQALRDSLYLGVTVEDNRSLERASDLLETPFAGSRFLCLEPLLEEVSISSCLAAGGIEWVIIGCESGETRRRTEMEWVRKLIGECRRCRIPVYVDQLDPGSGVTSDIASFPEDLRIREIPWKAEPGEQEGYIGVSVLGEGWIGYRESAAGELEFLIDAPEFVFRYWKESFPGVGEAGREFPFTYSAPKGPVPLRKLLMEFRDRVQKFYPRLLEKGASVEQALMIVPQDVMVRFKWRTGKEIIETAPALETEGKNAEVRQYLKAFKSLLSKGA